MKRIDENSAGVGSRGVLDRLGSLTRYLQTAVRYGGALLIFFIAYGFIDIFALSSVSRIQVDMESDQDAIAAIYYSGNLRKASFREGRSRHLAVKAGVRETYVFDLDNKVVKAIRLDPGDHPGTYRIYAIAPLGFYGKMEPIRPFLPEISIVPGPGTSVVKRDDFLEIIAETDDPYISIDRKIAAEKSLLLFFVPFIVTLLVLIALNGFRLTACAFWTDTIKKFPSGGWNYGALDGLRGLSALCVLAAHTGLPGCDSLGHVGVVTFFCLSGFLLSLPYARNGALILSMSNIRSYYLRRFRRIAPMFYFILLLTYLFNDRIDVFIRSMLFLQGNSILWTVLQEIHFYLFLPVILLIIRCVLRDNRVLIVGLLLALGYCFNHGLLTTYRIFALGQNVGIFAGIFLCGIMMSYFCQIEGVQQSRALSRLGANPLIGALLLAAIFGIEQLWALSHNGQIRNSSVLLYGNYNYLVGALIGMLVLVPHSLPGRLFNILPLRLVGTISYSFYLLHPLCLKVVKTFALDYLGKTPGGVEAFLATLFMTFGLSVITYTHIERPFLKLQKT